MTRQKKNRKTGQIGVRKQDRPQGSAPRNADQSKKRGKGHSAGNRQQVAAQTATTKSGNPSQDPRLGSRKPVSLVAPAAKPQTTLQNKPNEPQKPLTPQQEIDLLENDAVFMQQLELLEQGGVLPDAELQAFEAKLERYDVLLEELGLSEDDDEDDSLQQSGQSLKDEWS